MNGNIVIDRMIAKGGMSIVYHAISRSTGREYAIKSCTADSLYERSALEKEYDILCRINAATEYDSRGRHVPCVYGLSEYDDKWNYNKRSVGMIMEYINGRLLSDVLRKKACDDNNIRFEAERFFDVIIILCRVLDMLHSMNPPVYYCDVKPENITIRNNLVSCGEARTEQEIMIIDYGSAYLSGTDRKYSIDSCTRYGTVTYAAPEQFESDAVINERTDIYGIGRLLNVFAERYNTEYRENTDRDDIYNEEYLKKIIKRCTCNGMAERYCDISGLIRDIYKLTGRNGIVKSTIVI